MKMKTSRQILRWGCAALLVLAAASCSREEAAKPEVGHLAPDFTLADLDGVEHTLSDSRGKVVFVNLWATWCPPCRQEIPSMVRLYQAMKGQPFEILAVSEDRDVEAVRRFVAQYQIPFPVLMDPDKEVYRLYRATGVPETHLIDPQGRIQGSQIGPFDWEAPEVARAVRALMSR